MWKQNISPCIFFIFLWLIVLSLSDLIIYVFPWHTCHKIQFNRYTVDISKERETLVTLIEGKNSIFEFPFTMNCFLYDVGKIFKKFSRFIVYRSLEFLNDIAYITTRFLFCHKVPQSCMKDDMCYFSVWQSNYTIDCLKRCGHLYISYSLRFYFTNHERHWHLW